MSTYSELWIWDDQSISRRLDWYRQVATNRLPAKYLIASKIGLQTDLSARENDLWRELDQRTPEAQHLWNQMDAGNAELSGLPDASPNLADLAATLARRMLSHCRFCAWDCDADRTTAAGAQGTCQLGAETRVASSFQDMGEELVYRGTCGSGTISLSACNMRCSTCQDADISLEADRGLAVTARQLAAIAWRLRSQGCHNINWVGADPILHLHDILGAIALMARPGYRPHSTEIQALEAIQPGTPHTSTAADFPKREGRFNVPHIWNSNLFATTDTLRLLRCLIDVWRPDFTFGPGACATQLAQMPWYWTVVTRNLLQLQSWNEDMSVRHLLMPGHLECCTYPLLDWLAAHLPDVPLNIKDYESTHHRCDANHPGFNPASPRMARPLPRNDVQHAYSYARRLGLPFEALTFERSSADVQTG